MSIIHKLRALVEAISTRGVGHTTLMKLGTEAYSKPYIQIGSTMSSMKEASLDKNPNAKLITIDEILTGKLKGSTAMPVAIDNYVIREVLSDAILTIECMQDSIEKKNQVMEELMNIVEYYQDRSHTFERIGLELAYTPWWKIARIIKLEKRIHKAILDYNTDSNPVEEAFQRILNLTKQNTWKEQ